MLLYIRKKKFTNRKPVYYQRPISVQEQFFIILLNIKLYSKSIFETTCTTKLKIPDNKFTI